MPFMATQASTSCVHNLLSLTNPLSLWCSWWFWNPEFHLIGH